VPRSLTIHSCHNQTETSKVSDTGKLRWIRDLYCRLGRHDEQVPPVEDANKEDNRRSWFPGDDAACNSMFVGASNNTSDHIQGNNDNRHSWFPGDDHAYMTSGVGWASRDKSSSKRDVAHEHVASVSKNKAVDDNYAWFDLGEDDEEVVVEKVATAEVASRIAQPNRSSYGWLELNE
jgi:hypothetical protein